MSLVFGEIVVQFYCKNGIDSLADLFKAWMGGEADDFSELKIFLKSNILHEILDPNILDGILREQLYFPDYAVPIIYQALPLKFKVRDGEVTILPEEFNALNYKAAHVAHPVASIDVSLKLLKDLKQKLGTSKEIEVKREKARRYRRKYRALHPEKEKIAAKKRWEREKTEMTLERREAIRKAQLKYIRKNRKELAEKQKERRRREKLENPLSVYERDDKINHASNRKEIKKRYYERHKNEILARAKNNPKEKEWQRKYKAKVRFREKTGAKILSLLNGIINSKLH